METAVGRPHGPGKHVILTVGTDCAIGKMSVALELRRAAVEAGLRGVVRADRPDRDDDRGLGRGRRPASSPTSSRAPASGWSNRARSAATGSSSRARARSTTRPTRASRWGSSTARRPRPWSWSTSRASPSTTSTTCRAGRSRSRRCPSSSGSTSRSPASSRRRGSWRWPLNTSLLPGRGGRPAGSIAETAELTGLPTDDPFRFGGTAPVRRDPVGAGGPADEARPSRHEVHADRRSATRSGSPGHSTRSSPTG